MISSARLLYRSLKKRSGCPRDPLAGRKSTGLLLKSKVKEGDPQVTYYRKNSAASTLTSAEYPKDYFQCAGHLHVTGIPPALSADMKDFTYHVMNDMRNAGKTISFDLI